jgi:hypothetical protein
MLGRLDSESERLLLARRAVESDAATREVLSIGLVDGDREGRVSTQTLLEMIRAGRSDAWIAASALFHRVDVDATEETSWFEQSPDAVMRSQVARGLGGNPSPNALGHLLREFRFEGNARVRRAIVRALTSRRDLDGVPESRILLEEAAYLDPDPVVRAFARAPNVRFAPSTSGRDVACLRISLAENAVPVGTMTATVIEPGGVAVPIAFDDEGFAIVPGLPEGDIDVRLAPNLRP